MNVHISRRSQTGIEYIVILTIVIVLTLIVIVILNEFPMSVSKTEKETAEVDYRTDDVSVEDYYFSTNSSKIKIKNNLPSGIIITAIRFGDNNALICNDSNSDLPLSLKFGNYAVINCDIGKDQYPYSENQAPVISVGYIERKTGAAYTSGSENLINGQDGEYLDNCTKFGRCANITPPVYNETDTFHGGTGTIGDPYGISNWAQLNNIRINLSAYFLLLNDLDVSTYGYSGLGNNWVPIGNETAGDHFSGNFNGNNKIISNIIINNPTTDYVGLFGYSNGSISNLGLTNVDINGIDPIFHTGGLAGYSEGTINNCYSIGNVNMPGHYVGGLVGKSYGVISNSYSVGNVSGENYIGGLVGESHSNITNSHFTGNASGPVENISMYGVAVGGLVGVVYDGATIDNCSSSANVSGSQWVGGLAGFQSTGIFSRCSSSGSVFSSGNFVGGLVGAAYATITDTYSTAKVTGLSNYTGGLIGNSWSILSNSYSTGNVTSSGIYVGGMIGRLMSGYITASYYDSQTSGQSDNDGRGAPKTTAEMKTASTFSAWSSSVWNIADGYYPTLK